MAKKSKEEVGQVLEGIVQKMLNLTYEEAARVLEDVALGHRMAKEEHDDIPVDIADKDGAVALALDIAIKALRWLASENRMPL